MALVNGNEYDHIDFTKNGVTTRHMLKDTLSRQMSGDLVKVQNEEPTSEGTKIWIKPSGDSEVQVPTYEEFEELSDKIDDADATIESLAVGAQPTVSVTEVDGHKRFSFGIPASNGIASITKTATDGVIDTYTIAMTDGTSTSFSVNNSDITPESMAEAITTALQDYARIDGYYPDLTAGNADQLNSTKFVEDQEPYLYRPSGGTSDIGNRKYLDAIVGVSLPWNQMVRDEASENSTDFADVVTVTDAVEDSAALKVKIEPQQDLHGYDHPWPAGDGVNQLNMESVVVQNAYGFTVSKDSDGFFNIVGTYNGTASNPSYAITSKPSVPFDENMRFVAFDKNADAESCISQLRFTDSNGGLAIDSKSVMVNGQSYNMRFRVVECAKSETPTAYTPYSNICPITGWTAAKVTRTGKNLAPAEEIVKIASGTYNGISAQKTANGYTFNGVSTASGTKFFGGFPTYSNRTFEVLANKTYVISYMQTGGFHLQGNIHDENGNQILSPRSTWITPKDSTDATTGRNYAVFTPLANGRIAFVVNASLTQGTEYNGSISDIQLELASAPTDYESYQGNTYDITLPTEAGTVYGGELTIAEDGSGTLTVDRAMADMGSLVWNYNTTYAFFITSNSILTRKIGVLNVWSDLFKTMAGSWSGTPVQNALWGNGSNVTLYVQTPPLDNVNDFMALVDGHQLMYELATPITYTLTASQIRTLLGTNNVWSDAGQTALTYTGTNEHLTLESGKKYLARINGTDSMLLGSAQEIIAAKGTDNVFDLTKMFGTSVADYVYNQGTGYFRKWFGKTWYPYNTGELKHVEGLQSHDLVGFNVWDEEWESGSYNITTGEPVASNDYIRTKNAIRVLPGIEYAIKNVKNGRLYYYDAEMGFISASDPFSHNRYTLFTMPSNCHYLRYRWEGQAYSGDICISFAHNGSRNGEYAPYEKYSHSLDSTVILRGISKVDANGVYWDGDRYLPDGTVERRYGVVDLGTLLWNRASTPGDGRFFARLIDSIQFSPSADVIPNIVCCMYKAISSREWYTKAQTGISHSSSGYSSAYNIIVYDSAYTSELDFKAAMSGVYLVYELAEPTIEQALPYRNFQLVDDWGTEEFVTTGMIPVGHESRYPANLRDKLQHLPDAASSNGSYLITQTDGQMTLTPFPAPPTTAGKYVLRATVTNGVATFSWEATT